MGSVTAVDAPVRRETGAYRVHDHIALGSPALVNLRRVASTASIVLGVLFVLAAVGTALMVRSELDEQNIVTPEDACLPERQVTGPFTAYCQAEIIDEHARETTDGLTYAELPRDDPRREVAMQASFLRSSLYTSIVAYGVAAMAAAMGVLFILIGLGMRDVHRRVGADDRPAAVAPPG